MIDEKKPNIEDWRRDLTPETPSSSVHLPSSRPADRSAEAMDEMGDSGRRERRSRWRHPALEKIRNVGWVYMGLVAVGQLLVVPTMSMERHMDILENSNSLFSNLWWGTATGGAVQREYWRRERSREMDGWIERETAVAWDMILRNIGPVAGAADGVVIASPSRGETPDQPDYYYTWTRDSALTILALAADFAPEHYGYISSFNTTTESSNRNTTRNLLVEPLLRAYIATQAQIQTIPNPSGDLWSGGLNEPKHHVDGSRFDDEWGRPQRDGPALRALALIPYANYLLDRAWPADIAYVRAHLYDSTALRNGGSVIKNDLEEVGGGWWLSSFDLWEEVEGHHLFTLLACYRALQAGTRLAQRLDDPKAAEYYRAQSERLHATLPAFWDDVKGHWLTTATYDTVSGERQWLDCALPLSVSHFGWESDGLLAPSSSETLASLRAYIKSFDGMYAINQPIPRDALTTWTEWFRNSGPQPGQADWARGWAVGRYAEDVYNGVGTGRGNPWHICTYAVAQSIFISKGGFERQGYIPLNNLTRPFWADILGDIHSFESVDNEVWTEVEPRVGAHSLYGLALNRLEEVGDMYMAVGRKHAAAGRMSEQIDRHDGSPVGARDLTWSYASFLEAARARENAATPALSAIFELCADD